MGIQVLRKNEPLLTTGSTSQFPLEFGWLLAACDEPCRTVEEADKLLAAVMQRLAEGFANERSGLESTTF